MSNIIGESFRKYVIDQINTRQQKLGLGLRDQDVIKFENTNTPFIRLTSGVDVSGDVIKNALDLQSTTYDTNKLAKQFHKIISFIVIIEIHEIIVLTFKYFIL